MRSEVVLALCFVVGFQGIAQTAGAPTQGLPKDPRAIFAAAAPFYDFSDPSLKPFHLKASYQLYDDKGKPTEQGTFEHWWASPNVYRNTWTRAGSTRTVWHTADGKHASKVTGEPLQYFEYRLPSSLLSPLPDSVDLNPEHFRLYKEDKRLGAAKFPCIMVIPLMPLHAEVQVVPLGLFPTYCFDPQQPLLRAEFSFGTVAVAYNKIAKVQGKFLALDIVFYEGARKLLTAAVDGVNELDPSDAALTPPADVPATKIDKVPIDSGIAVGMLIKRVMPIYPQGDKSARVSGTVVLKADIGTDGGVHDLRVVEAPSPSLAASALLAVSQWQYKPYMLNGEPVEVETTVNVIYSLGR